jgi:hypothetical protein
MTSLKTIDQLAPDTIQNYRSKLRRLFLSLSTLNDIKVKNVKQKIARLESQCQGLISLDSDSESVLCD